MSISNYSKTPSYKFMKNKDRFYKNHRSYAPGPGKYDPSDHRKGRYILSNFYSEDGYK